MIVMLSPHDNSKLIATLRDLVCTTWDLSMTPRYRCDLFSSSLYWRTTWAVASAAQVQVRWPIQASFNPSRWTHYLSGTIKPTSCGNHFSHYQTLTIEACLYNGCACSTRHSRTHQRFRHFPIQSTALPTSKHFAFDLILLPLEQY